MHTEFSARTALWLQNGWRAFSKFGHHVQDKANEWEYCWDGPTPDYPFDTGELTLELVSSDAGDTQIVNVGGTTADGSPQFKKVQLTGTTPVAVPGTWTRIYDIELLSGGVARNAGTISLQVAGGGAVMSNIEPGEGLSHGAHVVMPRTRRGALCYLSAQVEKNKEASIRVLQRDSFLNPDSGVRVVRHYPDLEGSIVEATPIAQRIPNIGEIWVEVRAKKNVQVSVTLQSVIQF